MSSAKWLLLPLLVACAPPPWPTTRMVSPADYGSGGVTVSSTPNYTAGPDYVNTTSPDGATLFVCENGTTRPGNRVPPHTTPPC
jgi:hypothetical protein